MKTLLLTAALVLAAASASANAIYDFTGTLAGANVSPFTARLVVTDAAAQAGALSFRITGDGHDFLSTGDPLGLVSFIDNQWLYAERFGPTTAFGTMALNVTFPQDGSLAGSLMLLGVNQDLRLSGAGDAWTGSFGSDGICMTGCSITGSWIDPPGEVAALTAPVNLPEPSTLALLAGGVMLLAAWQSRRRAA